MTKPGGFSRIGVLAFSVVTLLSARAATQGTFVKMSDDVISDKEEVAASSADTKALIGGASNDCQLFGLAWHGEDVPGGGSLFPVAWGNPATINTSGRIAFMSQVFGAARNQGIFSAAEDGLSAIAVGCGAGGGSGDHSSSCGDPTPVGGTFSGLFTGTYAAPSINDLGDILFIADVANGDSPRGLFIYQADTGQIGKVAVVGDASPLGGFFSSIGVGSLNSARQVVFLADSGGSAGGLFLWDGGTGTVQKVAVAGDPVPGGGTFLYIGTERAGFVDGTVMPTGPLAGVNDLGQISFRGYVTGGQAVGGLFISDGTVHQWYAGTGDLAPIGGTYIDFGAPIVSNAGEIAFFADVNLGSRVTSGWFAGSPGNWRKGTAFYDPIDDGQVIGIAYSRNPHAPFDDAGRLALWVTIRTPTGDRERLMIAEPDGGQVVTVRQGDPTPFGGQIGHIQAWPSLSRDGQGTIGASTPGAGSIQTAQMVYRSCAP